MRECDHERRHDNDDANAENPKQHSRTAFESLAFREIARILGTRAAVMAVSHHPDRDRRLDRGSSFADFFKKERQLHRVALLVREVFAGAGRDELAQHGRLKSGLLCPCLDRSA